MQSARSLATSFDLNRLSFLAVPALAVGLSACSSGGGGGGSAACDSITGGASSVSSTGPAANSDRAADGDLYSYGALNFSPPSGSGTIRATAQDGVVFPAGSRLGAFVSFLDQSGSNATTIRTYLDGVLVESQNPGSGFFDFASGGGTGAGFYAGFVASAPFDAVEFAEVTSGSTGASQYRIYELCSDGHV